MDTHKRWYQEPVPVLLLLLLGLVILALVLLVGGYADLDKVLGIFKAPIGALGVSLLTVLGIKLPWIQAGRDANVSPAEPAEGKQKDEPTQ